MDRRELEKTYLEHRQGLYTLALSITRHPEAAEDAVHEAFLRLCRRDAAPRGDAVAYVFAAVRNSAADQRRRSGMRSDPVPIFNGQAPDPAAQAEKAELSRRLREALEGLPDEQREAVVLRVYAGLTFAQMAEVGNEPLQTVAARYRRALERLRREALAR